MPVERGGAPGSGWPYQPLLTLKTVENKSLLLALKAPLRLNIEQALLISGTWGHSLDKVTIMTLESQCKRLGFGATGNKHLFSGPRDNINIYTYYYFFIGFIHPFVLQDYWTQGPSSLS